MDKVESLFMVSLPGRNKHKEKQKKGMGLVTVELTQMRRYAQHRASPGDTDEWLGGQPYTQQSYRLQI